MAKWRGKIGFVNTIESSPGVWTEDTVERIYSGEVLEYGRRLQSTDQVNDDIVVVNQISILSDPFAKENFFNMRYIEFMGANWKVSNVKVQYPRLILTLGGVYNG